jgi:hypothetical protein
MECSGSPLHSMCCFWALLYAFFTLLTAKEGGNYIFICNFAVKLR